MSAWIAFSVLILIGAAHSCLGEIALLRPLFADDRWSLCIPRSPAQRILRFAWHLTTVAWVGLAASLVGVSPGIATGWVCLASGLLVVFFLRGHLAWPLFFLAGLAALESANALPGVVPTVLAALGIAVALGAAVVHIYWAAGGRAGIEKAIPRLANGEPKFRVGPIACVAVAAVLGIFAVLLGLGARGASPTWLTVLLGVALIFLVARAIGDGREVGFTKANHDTAFARADDAIYTPLVVLLAFGALAALHLGLAP